MSAASRRQQVAEGMLQSFKQIVNCSDFKAFKRKIKATQFHCHILNESHAEQCVPILAHAFSSGDGNYEVIKNLCYSDMLPIAKGWVDIALKNKLSFVLLDQYGKVAFVGIQEVIGFDENVSHELKLNKKSDLRRLLRAEFERNDPFWQKLIKWKQQNILKYGDALAGVAGSRPDLQGHPSLSTLGMCFWGFMNRSLADIGILKYNMADCTHWKTIALLEHSAKISTDTFGDKYFWKSSTFDVNEYIECVDNKDDFVYDSKKERKMVMFVQDFTQPLSRRFSWRNVLKEALMQKNFQSNAEIYDKYKSKL